MINTLPEAKTKVPKGSVVDVRVAAEPGVDVPDVTGKSAAEAQSILTAAGLQVTALPQASDTVPGFQAIGTDPPAGTHVPNGTAVRLFVSSGPSAVDVPLVIGQTQGAATNALVSAGFNVVVNPKPGGGGVVVNQSPAGGKLPRGGTVTITMG